MAEQLKEEDLSPVQAAEVHDCFSLRRLMAQLRIFLKHDKVCLWEEPYCSATYDKRPMPEEIVCRYASQCPASSKAAVTLALEQLQEHAIAKLKAKRHYEESGEATIYFCKVGEKSLYDKKEIKLHLEASVADMKSKLIEMQVLSNQTHVKLILAGKILKEGIELKQQGLKNFANVMILTYKELDHDVNPKQVALEKNVEDTKVVAVALAKRRNAGEGRTEHYFLEIHDQLGRKVELTDSQRESLSLALTYHEKGRHCLSEKKTQEALLFLLEADAMFKLCEPEVLSAVDNFAILCLDVVWCYFSLKNLDLLSDADLRLDQCEKGLTKSYGQDGVKLAELNDATGQELTFFLRFHLLRAICSYHMQDQITSKRHLDKAEYFIEMLQVDEQKLLQVIEMGFSSATSKWALRLCNGNVTTALHKLATRQELRAEESKRIKVERQQWKFSRKLGKTVNKQWVDVEVYKQLVQMGFNRKMVLEALKQSDNNMERSLDIIQNSPELLIPEKTRRRGEVPESVIDQVVAMGFDRATAKRALVASGGDIQNSIDKILSGNFSQADSASNDDGDSSEDDSENEDDSLSEEEADIDRKVLSTFDHLKESSDDIESDIDFSEEIDILNEYRTLLAMAEK